MLASTTTKHTRRSEPSSADKFITTLQEALAWTTEDGALTQVFAAAASAITDNKITGTYFQPIGQKVTPNKALVTKDNQVKLWKLSEELVSKLK